MKLYANQCIHINRICENVSEIAGGGGTGQHGGGHAGLHIRALCIHHFTSIAYVLTSMASVFTPEIPVGGGDRQRGGAGARHAGLHLRALARGQPDAARVPGLVPGTGHINPYKPFIFARKYVFFNPVA